MLSIKDIITALIRVNQPSKPSAVSVSWQNVNSSECPHIPSKNTKHLHQVHNGPWLLVPNLEYGQDNKYHSVAQIAVRGTDFHTMKSCKMTSVKCNMSLAFSGQSILSFLFGLRANFLYLVWFDSC